MFKPSSKRTPSAALMVVTVAVLAGATVAALGFKTVTPVPAGVPKGADLITISPTTVGRPVPQGFVGLSLETNAVEPWTGTDPNHPDPVLGTLISNLAPGARPSLRIGGNTTDQSWYSPNHVPPPPGVRFTLDDTWLGVARALVTTTQARPIIGLNLKSNDSKLTAAEVGAFSTISGAPPQGGARKPVTEPPTLEIGNEPEKYRTQTYTINRSHHRPETRTRRYTFHTFAHDFATSARLVPGSTPLAGPAIGNPSWWPRIPAFLTANRRVRIATVHTYPLHNCVLRPKGAAAPSIAHLLAPTAAAGAAASVAPLVGPAHTAGAQLRVDELNSVSCGGTRGVSDSFASALWVIDTLFALAERGVDGVNIHAFPGAPYSPFQIGRDPSGRWGATVSPLYLGLLAFIRAAPAGSHLLHTGTPDSGDLRIWATRTDRGSIHVALLNTSPTTAHEIAIKLPDGRGPVHFERLEAASLAATKGATLDGQSFGTRTLTGELQGHRTTVELDQIGPQIYRLRLPAGSAGLLSR